MGEQLEYQGEPSEFTGVRMRRSLLWRIHSTCSPVMLFALSDAESSACDHLKSQEPCADDFSKHIEGTESEGMGN